MFDLPSPKMPITTSFFFFLNSFRIDEFLFSLRESFASDVSHPGTFRGRSEFYSSQTEGTPNLLVLGNPAGCFWHFETYKQKIPEQMHGTLHLPKIQVIAGRHFLNRIWV